MKVRLGYIIIVCMFVLVPSNMKAACSNAEKINLNKLAKNINYTFDYVENNNSVSFNITFTNVQPNFKLKDISTKKEYQDMGAELTLSGYGPGRGYRFDVYSKDVTCTRDKLASIYITLPFYNPFYTNELCNGIEEYKLCQKWVKNSLSYEESIKQITAYKDSIKMENANQIPKDQKRVKGIYDYLIEFYIKYYYIVLPIIIIVCLVAIYKINKKNRLA